MAKISTYSADSSIAGTEKLIGTDTDGTTLNYSISTIASYMAGTGITATDGVLSVSTADSFTIASGSGLDDDSGTLSVDVSDFMTNGANNYLLTATGTDAMNAEANLQFDGSTLTVTGKQAITPGDTGGTALTITGTDIDKPAISITQTGDQGIYIDHNFSTTTANTLDGLLIDLDKTGATTTNNTVYGIRMLTTNTTAEAGTNNSYSAYLYNTTSHAADAGTVNQWGIYNVLSGGTNGTTTAIGEEIIVTGQDTQIGLQVTVDTGQTHIKLKKDANDYATLAVADTGDLTIATVGDGSLDSDIILNPDGLLKTTAAAGVEIENGSGVAAPALLIDNDATGQIALDIDAANVDSNVVDITADAVTTGNVFNVSADALTTGSIALFDDNSSSTSTRGVVQIFQNNASASNANALYVQSDGAGPGVKIDKNSTAGIVLDIDASTTTANVIDVSATALTTGKAINVDVDAITTGYAAYFDIADTAVGSVNKSNGYVTINYAKSGVTGSGATNEATGLQINMVDAATNNASGAVNMRGLDIFVDSASNTGTIQNYGINLEAVTDGDPTSSYGIQMKVQDGGYDLYSVSTADTADYWYISSTTNGATTLATVDGGAAAANLTLQPDGDLLLNASASADLNIKHNKDGKDLIFQQYDGTEVARVHDGANLPSAAGTSTSIASGNTGQGGFGYRKMVYLLGSGNDDNVLTLTAAQSGGIVFVTPTNNVGIKLPVGIPGIHFKIVLADKISKVFSIFTNGAAGDNADNFYMHCVSTDDTTADVDGDTITFTNALEGSTIDLTCLQGGGSELWLAEIKSLDAVDATVAD